MKCGHAINRLTARHKYILGFCAIGRQCRHCAVRNGSICYFLDIFCARNGSIWLFSGHFLCNCSFIEVTKSGYFPTVSGHYLQFYRTMISIILLQWFWGIFSSYWISSEILHLNISSHFFFVSLNILCCIELLIELQKKRMNNAFILECVEDFHIVAKFWLPFAALQYNGFCFLTSRKTGSE